MKIELTDGYYITEDNYNYILNKRFVPQGKKAKKKESSKVVAYCSNGLKGFKRCLMIWLENVAIEDKKSQEITLNVFLEHLERIMDTKTEELTKRLLGEDHDEQQG